MNSSDRISWYNLNISLRQLNQIDEAIVESRCQITKNIAINGFRSLPPTTLQLSTVEGRLEVATDPKMHMKSKSILEPFPLMKNRRYLGTGLVKSDEIADINEHKVRDVVFNMLRVSESEHHAHRLDYTYGHQKVKLVFVCLKFGTKYGPEYVNNLYSGLRRGRLLADQEPNTHGGTDSRGALDDFRFVCYTDDPIGLCDGVEVHLLPMRDTDSSSAPHEDSHSYSDPQDYQSRAHEFSRQQLALKMTDWQGWWYKAYLFYAVTLLETRSSADLSSVNVHAEQGVEAGKERPWMCFLDLDTVICGSLDFLYHLPVSKNTQSADSFAATRDSPRQRERRGEGQDTSRPMSAAGTVSDSCCQEEDEEEEDEEILYTLSAAHFVSEGRPCGLNSSIMLWRPRGSRDTDKIRGDRLESDPRSSIFEGYDREGLGLEGESAATARISSLEYLFTFLLANYVSVNQCVYKFDHYLELMLLPPRHIPAPHASTLPTLKEVSSCPPLPVASAYSNTISAAPYGRTCGRVKVVYLQELHCISGKIVDFCSLTQGSQPTWRNDGQDLHTHTNSRDTLSEEMSHSTLDRNDNGDSIGVDLQDSGVSLDENALAAASIICFPLSPKPHTAAISFPVIRVLWEASGPLSDPI